MGKIKVYEVDTDSIKILATVSRLMDVSIKQMRGSNRTRDIVEARRIAMVLINDKLRYTCTKIAKIFKKNHATVLHSFKAHSDLMDVDKEYEEFFNVCATAVGIKRISDSKDRREIIIKMAARIEFLETENEELREQINDIKNVLT